MNSTTKWIVWSLVIAGGVYGAYYLIIKNKKIKEKDTKGVHDADWYAKQIAAWGGISGSGSSLSTLDLGYLKAWYVGLVAGEKDFIYQGRSYHTIGGKVDTTQSNDTSEVYWPFWWPNI